MIPVRSFGASSAHKGLWLAQKMSPDMLNHALSMWDVDGEIDPAVMESAFRHVLAEAEVLRIDFVDDGEGNLLLVPRESTDWQPFFLDVGAEPDPEQAAREALADMMKQPFDLERDLLLRLGVVRLGPARSLVVIAYHHLVSDGYGAGGLLSRRLAEVYTALARGTAVPEQEHPWDVESFAADAARYQESPKFAEDTGFWRDYLAEAPAPAQVPRVPLSDAARAALAEPMSRVDRWAQLADSIGMVSRTLTVPRAEADGWIAAAESMGVWMSSLLTAASAVYFRHRCDRPEFLLSLAVANRAGEASRTPGLAVNVVPMRVKVPLGATFADIADAVVDETYEVFGQTACHYSEIQRASGTVLSGRGSFGAVLNIVEFAEQLHFADHSARYLGGTNGVFDELSIGVYTDGSADSDLFVRLDAPAGLYTGAELRFIGAELIEYVHAVTADPQLRVGALDVLGGDARDRVLTVPNETIVPLPGSTVPELFARRVAQAPDDVAVQFGESALTYRELHARSGRLAETLRGRGVGPETVVAVALPRSVDLAVALLAVVKAGGAYLPIDPTSRAERIVPVVRDSSVRVLLTDAATAEGAAVARDVAVILFDDVRPETAADTGDDAPKTSVPSRPDNLLAVMYGSGPDGKAAGVAVTHRNMERLALDRRWHEGGRGTVLWHSPITADALALELWVPLLNGGRVLVAGPAESAVDTLAASTSITAAWVSAGLFSAMAAQHPERLAGLREVWTGGDRVSSAALRRVREACPDLAIVHGHGPTEATVFAVCDRPVDGEAAHHAGSIGRPMDNTAVYVLGPGLAPVPVGVTGELYVAGPGVTRGRPGRPGQTAERFVPCPFGPAGGRMYRTGDLVRWGTDGGLEYVGAADARFDVRDVRVEPAEAEEVLSEHPGVAQAVVVGRADESGQPRLVAYVVPAGGTGEGAANSAGLSGSSGSTGSTDTSDTSDTDSSGPTGEELRRFAAERLAESVVPSAFVLLERLPLTAGGRVDRASLPKPDFDGGSYRGPRNRTERVLAALFADVLELDRVGIDQDFFDLGGNSLRAIRLVGLIRAELNLEVSIRTLFAARTIIGLSDMWGDLSRSSRPALRRRTKDGKAL
ncbi:non-ribosomal peptide synthetase [Embleya sp. MST-111070]|uniref:non-ribosomal peptide synthetase n=1 Tax=Embleya sp. MST-111070 TaxID=3398231 RepID=UPI003F739E2E